VNTTERSITVANDEWLSGFVLRARHRLVVLAPALTESVAEAVCTQWRTLGTEAVSVTIDVNPEVYRLGYGDPKALTLLQDTAISLETTLHQQEGIRIGLMIADDTTVVYAPTPRFIEAGPQQEGASNAVVLGCPPLGVAQELGAGPEGRDTRTVGREPVSQTKIVEMKENLTRNPPQKFDISRTVLVFNAHFEFVEFHLKHAAVHKTRVSLPRDIARLTGNDQIDDLLHSSIELVTDDPLLSGKSLEWLRARIAKNYLITLPGYGTVVLRRNKPDFEKKVAQLERCVMIFSQRVNERLTEAIDRTRQRLCKQILPKITKSPPTRWHKFLGPSPTPEEVQRMLDTELGQVFDKTSARLDSMHVTKIFKGVTYEMLNDHKFIRLAQKHLPGLSTHREFEAAQAKRPLDFTS
jgi:hypothetical protein